MKPVTIEDLQRTMDLLGPMPKRISPIKVTKEQMEYLKALPQAEANRDEVIFGIKVELCKEGEDPTFP